MASEPMHDAFGQMRLARTQATGQRQHIAISQLLRQSPAARHRGGFVGQGNG